MDPMGHTRPLGNPIKQILRPRCSMYGIFTYIHHNFYATCRSNVAVKFPHSDYAATCISTQIEDTPKKRSRKPKGMAWNLDISISWNVYICFSTNEPRKQPSYFSFYWLVNRDPYHGLLQCLYNCMGNIIPYITQPTIFSWLKSL